MLEREFKTFELPIRAEILNIARLEAHAKTLAHSHQVTGKKTFGKNLIPRIRQNLHVLEESYETLVEAVTEKRAITPAAEWLIDNFHIVREQVKDIHDNLPSRFYRELPKLADGPLKGYPRIYGIAWDFVAHTDSHFDEEYLKKFISAYQTVTPLTIGELWALSVTVPLVLIENLRRLAARIAGSQIARKEADYLADEILNLRESPSRPILEILKSLNQSNLMVHAFSVQLLQRLRFQEGDVEPVLTWLDKELNNRGISADDVVEIEHGSQMSANATVRNIILSLRKIASSSWQEIFEDISLVDQILRSYPTYAEMDFDTRNLYRQAVEKLSKRSTYSEQEIAQKIIDRSQGDPGLFLVSDLRNEFEKEIRYKPRWSELILRFYTHHAMFFYMSSLLLLSVLVLSAPLQSTPKEWFWLALFGLVPASEIAQAIVNRITIALLGPRHLPRMSFEKGVPDNAKTFVVVPTMLTHEHKIDDQLEQLEVHYLSNPDKNIYFALLTDFSDADHEHTPKDSAIRRAAFHKITRLNKKYPKSPEGLDRFYIFHRRRLFNPNEGKWMGWERKRGKLAEFNRLLLGEQDTTYISLDRTPLVIPRNIRYVITLDADTRMPTGTAGQLIGTMAHTLNRPFYDAQKQRVTSGYGILQPRITPTLPSQESSTLFQKITTGDAGVDPYASAVSDVYQDLFSEGSFAGKGIYDLKMFEQVLRGKVPENAVLSHDLFEGNYLRCGFLSDVELFEDFPSHTEVATARNHRWIRGDWQLLPWVFGRGCSWLGRWKMVDNLRRSLVMPACFAILVLSFAVPQVPALPWFLLVLASLAAGSIVQLIAEIFTVFRKVSFRQNLVSALMDFETDIHRFIFNLSMMPHYAGLHLDAICRAVYRTYVSKKKMLEWTAAAQVQAAASLSLRSFLFAYRRSFLFTILFLAAVIAFNPSNLALSFPLFLVWFISPFIGQKASTPLISKTIKPLTRNDIQLLGTTARRIWYFFSKHVTAEDHYLPPDNLQETPKAVVAHRSSPTNFGLYLLSVISAKDFGWLGTLETAEHLERTLESMQRLPKHEGHFYNWYDTKEFRVLHPMYISSVDNGNLAGHLLAVSQFCSETLHSSPAGVSYTQGLRQTLHILEEAVQSLPSQKHLQDLFAELNTALLKFEQLVPLRCSRWANVIKLASEILGALQPQPGHPVSPDAAEALNWAKNLLHDAQSVGKDIRYLLSWNDYLQEPEGLSESESGQWQHLHLILNRPIPLKNFDEHFAQVAQNLRPLADSLKSPAAKEHCHMLLVRLEESRHYANLISQKLERISEACHRLFYDMDFRLLFDSSRRLFSIGYRVSDRQLDDSYYDLLASEARLTSFIAIAKGDVATAHWFRLGRGLAPVHHSKALVSWSGSMFEYLMPSLVMETPEGSIIERSCELSVERQISYGDEKEVPWGVSESAYNKRDLHLTYQYSNFGVPDLGLKRDLGANLVVAPYATLLAAMYKASEAVENLRRLKKLGGQGTFGFYEAIDFTRARLQEGENYSVVKAYMAHHQGMSLVSITNILKNGLMRQRFHNHPLVRSAELLLQERMPRNVSVTKPVKRVPPTPVVREEVESVSREYHTVNRPVPTTLLLGDYEYSVMLTSAGSGYSRFQDIAVSRWREDVTKDNWGSYIFLKDVESQDIWSATFQPTAVEPENYRVTFFDDRARFQRSDHQISSELEVFISPENPAEIRKLTLMNQSEEYREIEVTSYFEVVLNKQAADVAHPCFSNLFVQTEYLSNFNALLATRRPRSSQEQPLWMMHLLVPDKYTMDSLQYETNRAQFLGRGRDIRNPKAIFEDVALTNTVGSVLDPIMSLRTKVRIPPKATAQVTFVTAVASSRTEITFLAEQLSENSALKRLADLAWTQAQVKLHYYNMEPDEAHLFQRLATRLLFLDSSLRPSGELQRKNTRNVTNLWAYGVSGDLPIALVRIDNIEDRGIIRQLIKAHDYLGSKNLQFDLVILNDKPGSYSQDLQNALESLAHGARPHLQGSSKHGKIYTLRSDLIPLEDRLLLYAISRVTLSSLHGSLSEQVKRTKFFVDPYSFYADKSPAHQNSIGVPISLPPLKFFNGLGGFTEDGREYVISLKGHHNTPAPWVNVIANPHFGFQVSESGSGYTWAENSRENQLTPWKNDPVSDPGGECFYLLDTDNETIWSPTALPIRIEGAHYVARHGSGYSRFEHESHGIHSELTQFVDWKRPVKISTLKLTNTSKKTRNLRVCHYLEWVLGFSKDIMAPTTMSEFDSETNALFAWNSRSDEYGSYIAFLACAQGQDSYTSDRSEFLGRNGSLSAPGGLFKDEGLSRKTGANLDPCAALVKNIELQPGENIELHFFLGQSTNRAEARKLLHQLQGLQPDALLQQVIVQWETMLTKIQVETPDESTNILLNRWLLYQTLSCRFWARAGFYQAGGAYGFRDQLQDSMALNWVAPEMAREHILRAAQRQFVEGDVQHWWHPPFGRGVRTHFSDDLLWLPYVVAHYIKMTGDRSILEAQATFLEGPVLRPEQEDAYFTPKSSHSEKSIYEHCLRALNRSLKVGVHGLPLIGAGDWNDGMNRVGHAGRGESVWMAWFLYTNLIQFSEIAEARYDQEVVSLWRDHAHKLKEAVEKNAWDGEWYRRAYYDDGTPIGSATQAECKIDSIPQTWAVISKAGNPDRIRRALISVEKYLINKNDKIVLLFTPPYDKTSMDPGYIKGYLPGVRENGGQYTHAAIWCVIAYAELQEKQKAHELFKLLNPINHGLDEQAVHKYKVEPYVLAADIYSQTPYTGRGGWTWYTGSSSWMYRAGLEHILGFQKNGDELVLNPCIPKDWHEFKITYRHLSTTYIFIVKNGPTLKSSGFRIKLKDDGLTHQILVDMREGLTEQLVEI